MQLQSPTRDGCWLQNFSVHHTMKIVKLLDYKTLWCKNTVASSRIMANQVSVTLLHSCEIFSCAIVRNLFTALKIILIYVQGCQKRKPKHISMDWMKNNPKKLNFINLNKQPSVELAVETWVSQLFKPRQMLAIEL